MKTLKQRQHETGRTLALNGAAWRRLRAHVLSEHPLCETCQTQGHTVAATDVDHRDNNPSNNDRDNLAALCKPHHSMKTRQDYGAKVVHGCDATGLPKDPAHHWNHTS